MFKALDLACYINDKHKELFGKNVSSIKLQKSLYFLFAYWGGMVEKSLRNPDSVEEDFANYSNHLFEDEIQAWTYGPVIPNVYYDFKRHYAHHYNRIDFEEQLLEECDGKLKPFIDDLLEEIFMISDFRLVDISHEDQAWKNRYIVNELQHSTVIPKGAILDEYAIK